MNQPSDISKEAETVPWGCEMFKHISDEYGLILTQSEIQDILEVAKRLNKPAIDQATTALQARVTTTHKQRKADGIYQLLTQ